MKKYLFFFTVVVIIGNHPASISSDQFSVDVSVSGAIDGTNYLRADLYKDGTNNYFGETFNGTDWHSDSTGTNYLPVQIVDSTGSATLQARVGSPSSGEYPGPGSYKLKIRRYTTSGSSYTFSDPVDIQITYQTPVPTATSAPDHTSAPTPAPTVVSTAIPTRVPTQKPTAKPVSTSKPDSTFPPGQILGASSVPTAKPQDPDPKQPVSFAPFVLVGSGVILMAVPFYPSVRRLLVGVITRYNRKDEKLS